MYLEDDPADVRLVRDALADDGLRADLVAVDNCEAYIAALDGADLILADYSLPTFDGREDWRCTAIAVCPAPLFL